MAGAKRKSKKKSAKLKVVQKPARQEVGQSKDNIKPAAKKRKLVSLKRTPKHERPDRAKLISAPKLFIKSCRLLLSNWKLFAIILGFYALLYIVLVGGLSNGNLNEVKSGLIAGHVNGTALTRQLLSTLISSGNNANSGTGVFETFLFLFISLVLIWAIRKTNDGHQIKARDAFYNGMYPFVPVLLVLLVLGLQLLPMVFGGAVYTALVTGGITRGLLQNGIVFILALGLVVLSIYWVVWSIIAVYAATYPDTAPMQALRSARELVRFRRFEMLRKLLFLPLVIALASIIVLIPIVRFATPFATLVFFGLTTVSIAVVHSYMYTLYRELS